MCVSSASPPALTLSALSVATQTVTVSPSAAAAPSTAAAPDASVETLLRLDVPFVSITLEPRTPDSSTTRMRLARPIGRGAALAAHVVRVAASGTAGDAARTLSSFLAEIPVLRRVAGHPGFATIVGIAVPQPLSLAYVVEVSRKCFGSQLTASVSSARLAVRSQPRSLSDSSSDAFCASAEEATSLSWVLDAMASLASALAHLHGPLRMVLCEQDPDQCA